MVVSIPVALSNPGQVFACLGFLETAEVLLGGTEGGFDWGNESAVSFELRSKDTDNPFQVVLSFLARAEIRRRAPKGYTDPVLKKTKSKKDASSQLNDYASESEPLDTSETFPSPKGDHMALPIHLKGPVEGRPFCLEISHWADASSRDDFKLYAGNRSAPAIARAMLNGSREKSRSRSKQGGAKTLGVTNLWESDRERLLSDPFGVLTPMGGSFNFDPRGAWTAIDAGYSPNDQKHVVTASPVVEILAAIGMEHARPLEYERRQIRYGAWGCLVSPILARTAIGCTQIGIPLRTFRFTLAMSGKNKVATFAEEEIT
jgi:CRISPR-associated protein Csx14